MIATLKVSIVTRTLKITESRNYKYLSLLKTSSWVNINFANFQIKYHLHMSAKRIIFRSLVITKYKSLTSSTIGINNWS